MQTTIETMTKRMIKKMIKNMIKKTGYPSQKITTGIPTSDVVLPPRLLSSPKR